MTEGRYDSLTKLGKGLHKSEVTGNIIVKIKEPVQPGSIVVDEKLRKIGTVIEVFGPVASPYASIKPINRADPAVANRLLYVFKNQPSSVKRKRFR